MPSEVSLQIASLFSQLQDFNTKNQADKVLQEFLKDVPKAIETLCEIIDQNSSNYFNSMQKLSASIQLKNILKKYYSFGYPKNCNFNEKIMNILITNCFNAQSNIQQQLSLAVSFVLDSLDDDLNVENSELGQYITKIINLYKENGKDEALYGLFLIFENLTSKYQTSDKSDELFIQILTIESKIKNLLAKTIIDFTNRLCQGFSQIIFKILNSCISFLLNMTYFDLIEFAEDNINMIIDNYLRIISIEIQIDNPNYPSVITIKTHTMNFINFYAQKYLADIKDRKMQILETVMYQLLNNAHFNTLNDILISKYFKFLGLICIDNDMHGIFQKQDIIKSICNDIVMNNIEFREDLVEIFMESPEEFVQNEIINLDSNSRRKSCSDFLKVFASTFESEVVPFFMNMFDHYMTSYYQNPQKNGNDFERALVILYSLCSRGYTKKFGATELPKNVDILSIISKHIHPKIKQPSQTNPINLTTCMKIIYIFRSFLDPIKLEEIIQDISACFNSENPTVTLAASFIFTKLLNLAQKYVTEHKLANIKSISETMPKILKHLMMITLLPRDEKSSVLSENSILLNSLIEIFAIFGNDGILIIANEFDKIIDTLTKKITEISENITKPHFFHSLFELLALLIRISYQINHQSIKIFESYVFPVFETAFVKQIDASIPYALQVLSLMLNLQVGSENISKSYNAMIKPLLDPCLWENNANIHPVVSLLQSLMLAIPDRLDVEFFDSLTLVIKRLIISRSLENKSLNLIYSSILIKSSIYQKIGKQKLDVVSSFFDCILTKIKSKKTFSITSGLCVAISALCYTESIEFCVSLFEKIQPGLFNMVMTRLFVPNMSHVSKGINYNITLYCAFKYTDYLKNNDKKNDAIINELICTITKSLNNIKDKFFSQTGDVKNVSEDILDINASVGTMEYNKIVYGPPISPFISYYVDRQIIKDFILLSSQKLLNDLDDSIHSEIKLELSKFLNKVNTNCTK